MEGFRIVLDDGTGKAFDAALRDNTLPDDGQPRLITKDNGTEEGNPAVMLTFGVVQTDGTIKNVQTVITAKLFLSAARVIKSKYSSLLI